MVRLDEGEQFIVLREVAIVDGKTSLIFSLTVLHILIYLFEIYLDCMCTLHAIEWAPTAGDSLKG